uniref:Uncharacterized protein n=1 Tax=Lepeophtheirus salmonis TaxID=72036 RepID=A0A0K2TU07_LEPSM
MSGSMKLTRDYTNAYFREKKLSSQARSSRWNVAPFLDNGLLNLSGVLSGTGADLFGYINALFNRFEAGNQFGDLFASLLGFQVTVLLWDFLNDSFFLIETLFGPWLGNTAGGTTQLSGNLLTFSYGTVFLDVLLFRGTDLFGPFGTFLLGGVTLGDILALLFLNGLTVDNVIFNIVFMITSFTLGFVDSLTFFGSITFAD